jgi:hypothetical protein
MSKAKSAKTNDSTEDSFTVVREAKCPASSGKSTLSYQMGRNDSGDIFIKVSGNDGGGFWSQEWVAYKSIEQAISEWPVDQGICRKVGPLGVPNYTRLSSVPVIG